MGTTAHRMPLEPTDDFVPGLIRRYGAALRKYLARQLRNEADAADVAQETYLKLSRLARPPHISSERAFLFHAARRLAIDHYRRRQRSVLVPLNLQATQVTDETPSPERQVLAREALRRLEPIIEELPLQQRRAFILCHFMEVPRAEIAATLGITISTVDQHIWRAAKYCQRQLAERGLI